jgi:hypothetical protein
MKRWVFGTGFAVMTLLVGACASSGVSGVTRVSPDTYRLSRVDGGGRYADAAAMKASVINDANAFAQGQGKIAVPIATHEESMRVGHLSTIDYEFRLVAPGETAPQPIKPVQRPDAVADQTARKAVDVQPAGEPAAKPDLYTELIKLDDLRKRGILTEEEFQTLKAKVLAGK